MWCEWPAAVQCRPGGHAGVQGYLIKPHFKSSPAGSRCSPAGRQFSAPPSNFSQPDPIKAATQHLEKFEHRQTITTPIASQDAYPILQDAQGQQCRIQYNFPFEKPFLLTTPKHRGHVSAGNGRVGKHRKVRPIPRSNRTLAPRKRTSATPTARISTLTLDLVLYSTPVVVVWPVVSTTTEPTLTSTTLVTSVRSV